MRLLHVHSGNIYGGIETMLSTIAREGARAGCRTSDFALSFRGRLHDELAAAGSEPLHLGDVRLRYPFEVRRARRALRACIDRRHPDAMVVHAPWTLAVFGPALRRSATPLVSWHHGPSDGLLRRLAVRTVPDAIICNSACTAGSLPAAYRGVPVAVLPNPVSPPRPEAAAARERTRASLGAAPDTVVIVQASRLEAWKGHEAHLRALGQLASLPQWTLWVAGAGHGPAGVSYAHHLRRVARDLGIAGRVQFLGARADVDHLLAAADVYCQPNTGPEPFGIAYVEALWAGLPVVASDAGGPREIVSADCGFVVTPGDVDALAGVLRRLVLDGRLRRRLGAAGGARAAALCDPARQLRLVDRFIEGIAARPGVSCR